MHNAKTPNLYVRANVTPFAIKNLLCREGRAVKLIYGTSSLSIFDNNQVIGRFLKIKMTNKVLTAICHIEYPSNNLQR